MAESPSCKWYVPSLKDMVMGLCDLIWPARCKVCDRVLAMGDNPYVCQTCLNSLPRTGYETYHDNPVFQLMEGRVVLHSAFSAYFFRKGEKLRQIIHAFKYQGRDDVAVLMGERMGRLMLRCNWHADYDVIVPVPMHPRKQKRKGYNQTVKLAEGVANVTRLAVREDILLRVLEGSSQTKKNTVERWLDIQHLYVCENPESYRGLRILLLDDVLTTGGTLEVCVNALQAIPDVKVGIATLSIVDRY